jgi:hypothetical protein
MVRWGALRQFNRLRLFGGQHPSWPYDLACPRAKGIMDASSRLNWVADW